MDPELFGFVFRRKQSDYGLPRKPREKIEWMQNEYPLLKFFLF